MSSPTQPAQLTDVLGAVVTKWPIVVAGMGIGAIVGACAALALPTSYDATASVAVRAMNAGPLAGSVEAAKSVSMPTETQVARSATVSSIAAQALAATYDADPGEVAAATSVVNPDDSLILKITYSASSATEAAHGANAVANAYLSAREADAQMALKRLRASLDKQLRGVRTQGANASGDIARRAANTQADRLAERLAELANFDPDPGQIIGEATAPASATTPGLPTLAAGGLVLGLLIAAPLAVSRRPRPTTTVLDTSALANAGLHTLIVDGTRDESLTETFDIAALIVRPAQPLDPKASHVVAVNADPRSTAAQRAGQLVADALERRGLTTRLLDGTTPVEQLKSAGRISVVDTTHVSAAAATATAAEADAVVLVRAVGDDARAYQRLCELLAHQGVAVNLALLVPGPLSGCAPTARAPKADEASS